MFQYDANSNCLLPTELASHPTGRKQQGYQPHEPREPEQRFAVSRVQRVSRPWHVELATFFLTQPRVTNREAAKYFGVTESWLSSVINSDAFREFLRQRQDEHFSNVSLTLVDKVKGLADQTVTAMQERVERDGHKMPLESLQSTAELALRSLGFGAPARNGNGNGNATQTNVQVVVADRDALAAARESMRTMRERVIDPELQSQPQPGQRILEHSYESVGGEKAPIAASGV